MDIIVFLQLQEVQDIVWLIGHWGDLLNEYNNRNTKYI